MQCETVSQNWLDWINWEDHCEFSFCISCVGFGDIESHNSFSHDVSSYYSLKIFNLGLKLCESADTHHCIHSLIWLQSLTVSIATLFGTIVSGFILSKMNNPRPTLGYIHEMQNRGSRTILQSTTNSTRLATTSHFQLYTINTLWFLSSAHRSGRCT